MKEHLCQQITPYDFVFIFVNLYFQFKVIYSQIIKAHIIFSKKRLSQNLKESILVQSNLIHI